MSAFLSAARSPLQYACNEASQKPGGRRWYDNQISANGVVKFFRDKRDFSIHEKPISPSARIGLYVTEHLSISEAGFIAAIREDGTMETQELSSLPSPPNPPDLTLITHEYFFGDWSGKEDVVALSQKYLKEVEAIVTDGVAKGFLTP